MTTNPDTSAEDPDRTRPNDGGNTPSPTPVRRHEEIAIGVKLHDRFIVRGRLGAGGFGTVYLANDTRLGRDVALKVSTKVEQQQRSAILAEAKASAPLRHANIVSVFDVLDGDPGPMIVSQWIEGETLLELIAKGPLEPIQAAKLARCIADALSHAHAAKIIHRDVKPSNILVDRSHVPFLTDFGLSRSMVPDIVGRRIVGIAGTLNYMSPEQFKPTEHTLDGRTDIYSLGIVLYEMLTGRRLDADKSTELMERARRRDVADVREVRAETPRDLAAICMKCMAYERDDRYRDAGELRDDLDRFLAGEPVNARPLPRLERIGRRIIRSAWTRVAAVALFITATYFVTAGIARREVPAPRYPVTINTTPPGIVTWVPIDAIGDPIPKRMEVSKSGEKIELPAGEYRVTAVHGDDHIEVRRVVPGPKDATRFLGSAQRTPIWERDDDGLVHAADIVIPSIREVVQSWTYFEGGTFVVGEPRNSLAPEREVQVSPFYLAPEELTWGEARRLARDPALGGDAADSAPTVDGGFDFYEWLAEQAGASIMSEEQYNYAATMGGKSRFPWGDQRPPEAWPIHPVYEVGYFDQTPTTPPVYGLLSGAAEWTSTLPSFPDIEGLDVPGMKQDFENLRRDLMARRPFTRVYCGGDILVARAQPTPYGPVHTPALRPIQNCDQPGQGLGLRLSVSVKPRFPPPEKGSK